MTRTEMRKYAHECRAHARKYHRESRESEIREDGWRIERLADIVLELLVELKYPDPESRQSHTPERNPDGRNPGRI